MYIFFVFFKLNPKPLTLSPGRSWTVVTEVLRSDTGQSQSSRSLFPVWVQDSEECHFNVHSAAFISYPEHSSRFILLSSKAHVQSLNTAVCWLDDRESSKENHKILFQTTLVLFLDKCLIQEERMNNVGLLSNMILDRILQLLLCELVQLQLCLMSGYSSVCLWVSQVLFWDTPLSFVFFYFVLMSWMSFICTLCLFIFYFMFLCVL